MPERQISWRRVAHHFGGTFEAKTFSTHTRFVLQALIDGQHVEVRGRSTPFSGNGDFTQIRCEERELAGLTVHVFRDRERTSFWRNVLWRDVEVGDRRFDFDWFLRAKRGADAQLVLDKESRRLIQAVPPAWPQAVGDNGLAPFFFDRGYATSENSTFKPVYYEFAVADGEASAKSNDLESSEERMRAAMRAVVGLSKMHERLLAQWTQLAKDLDGRIQTTEGWRVDRGMRVVFPLQGRQVTVSLRVEKGRLYTRVSCACARGHHPLRKAITPSRQGIEHDLGDRVEFALEAARAARVFQDADALCADLAGNITEASRVLAGASVVTSRASSGDPEGPYR